MTTSGSVGAEASRGTVTDTIDKHHSDRQHTLHISLICWVAFSGAGSFHGFGGFFVFRLSLRLLCIVVLGLEIDRLRVVLTYCTI